MLDNLDPRAMSPRSHIASRSAATIMGRQAELGTIEVGKIADLVLLEANPLDDIGNVRRIATVIQAGRTVP